MNHEIFNSIILQLNVYKTAGAKKLIVSPNLIFDATRFVRDNNLEIEVEVNHYLVALDIAYLEYKDKF